MKEIVVSLMEIDPSPWQLPGRSLRNIKELAASMSVVGADGLARGQLDAGLARPKGGRYELIAGHRRKEALALNGYTSMRLIVRDLCDEDARVLFYVSNAQRADLTPLEESVEFEAMRADLGWSPETIAERTGKSVRTVYRRLALCGLVPKAKELLEAGKVPLADAESFALLAAEVQEKALTKLEQDVSGEAQQSAQHRRGRLLMYTKLLANAPWTLEDKTLVKQAGACGTCPKRTNAQLTMFGEHVADDDFCLDDACWVSKFDALWRRETKLAREHGYQAIDGQEAKRLAPHGASIADPEYTALEAVCHEVASTPAKTYGEVLDGWRPLWAVVRTETDILHVVRTALLEDELKARGIAKATTHKSEGKSKSKGKSESAEPSTAPVPAVAPVPPTVADEKIEAGLGELHKQLATKAVSVHALKMLASMLIDALDVTRRPCERRSLEPADWTRDGIADALREWLTTQDDGNAVMGLVFELAYDHLNEHSPQSAPKGLEAVARFFGLEERAGNEVPSAADEPDDHDAETTVREIIKSALEEGPLTEEQVIRMAKEALEESGLWRSDQEIGEHIGSLADAGEIRLLKSGRLALQTSLPVDKPAIEHHTAKVKKPGKGRPPIKALCEIDKADLNAAELMSEGAEVGCAECKKRMRSLSKKVAGART